MISSKAAFVLMVGEGRFLSGLRGDESSSELVMPSNDPYPLLACKQRHR